MKVRTHWTRVVMMGLVGVLTPSVAGAKDDAKVAREEVYSMLPVDSMMKQAADNISRRYNLNPHQAQLTHDMMVREVTRFLEEHEDEIWPLIRDLARHQRSGGKGLDPKTVQRLGKAILPVFEAAKQRIIEANEEWREILTSQQKKLHDYDLQEMDKTFEQMGSNYQQWARGNPVKQGIFPEPRPDNPPVNPPKPAIGDDSTEKVIGPHEKWWDTYVANFIRDYALDKTQIAAARSILKEVKQRAAAYRAAHRAEFDAMARKLQEARREGNRDKIRRAMQEERKLRAFIPKLFRELKERLDKIPTPAQKAKYEAKKRKSRRMRSASPPRATPASRPVRPKADATSRPADNDRTEPQDRGKRQSHDKSRHKPQKEPTRKNSANK